MMVFHKVMEAHGYATDPVSNSVDVFFFQAKDGIRDYKVTGVQTCALPILTPRSSAIDSTASTEPMPWARPKFPWPCWYCGLDSPLGAALAHQGGRSSVPGNGLRSEERRVGKEGRSRWSPYH